MKPELEKATRLFQPKTITSRCKYDTKLHDNYLIPRRKKNLFYSFCDFIAKFNLLSLKEFKELLGKKI